MYNILIVSHGNLAQGFLDTAKMIVGDISGVEVLGIEPGEGIEGFGKGLDNLAKEIYTNEGLLVFVDLYGGTPSNVSIIRLLNKYENVHLISGINLPILLEALGNRAMKLTDVKSNIINAGKDGIRDINQMVAESVQSENDE